MTTGMHNSDSNYT